jgi:hypothetical protein
VINQWRNYFAAGSTGSLIENVVTPITADKEGLKLGGIEVSEFACYLSEIHVFE